MFGLEIGQRFKIKTGFKSKYKGCIFFVKKITDCGTLLIHIEGKSGYFYITKKRSLSWFKTHIEIINEQICLENK